VGRGRCHSVRTTRCGSVVSRLPSRRTARSGYAHRLIAERAGPLTARVFRRWTAFPLLRPEKRASDTLRDGLYAGSLDSSAVACVSSEIRGNVAVSGKTLLFARGTVLWCRSFDWQRMQLDGESEVVASDLLEPAEHAFFLRGFAAANQGLIVYPSSADFAWRATWIERSGKEASVMPGGCFRDPAISPDGTRVAFAADEYASGTQFICVHDFGRSVRRRMTDGGFESQPAWSADGKRLAYLSTVGGVWNVWEIQADGSASPRLIGGASGLPTFAADGRLVVNQIHGRPLLATRAAQETEFRVIGPRVEPQVSPDGRWIAAGQLDEASMPSSGSNPARIVRVALDGGLGNASKARLSKPRTRRLGRDTHSASMSCQTAPSSILKRRPDLAMRSPR
jgi:WD40-like Beta Propeller Repeat